MIQNCVDWPLGLLIGAGIVMLITLYGVSGKSRK